MRDGSAGDKTKSVLDQNFDLLEYLSAVAREIGPKPVRDVKGHPYVLWPAEVPEHRAVRLGPASDRLAWLEVGRLPAPTPAPIPDSLANLLDDLQVLENPDAAPHLSSSAVSDHVAAQLEAEFGELAPGVEVGADDERTVRGAEHRDDIDREFMAWKDETWTPWADRVRPAFAARALYASLYDLHLRADVDSATHEVVWGHLVLSCRSNGEAVVAPLLATKVIVEVDPNDATIRVIPENTVALELDAVEGVGLAGLDGLVKLKATLRESPPDPWSPDERLAVRGQIIAPLGLDAVLHDSREPAAPGPAAQLNDGWVLVMRKRALRQERFYDELAHKIRDEEFLPESLASVVADRDRVDSALVALGCDVTNDDGSANRLMMPLSANKEQERIARQLATSRGVTVQGPPGTGKSHTIVNLVSHLVAQGKRVLVTAEKEQALTVLRDKIPEQLRDLSIAVLGSTPSAMEDLRSAAQSMQDSLSAIDVHREERRIAELGARIDELRESLQKIDHSLVEALRSEQREYPLPEGPARAPQVAEWLAVNRELDVLDDRVPTDSAVPVTDAELAELATALRSTSAQDAEVAILDLPEDSWLPTGAELRTWFERLEVLRAQVTALEDSGLRLDGLDGLALDEIQQRASAVRHAAGSVRSLTGNWEDGFASAARAGDPAVPWVAQHNAGVRRKLAEARHLANDLAGHLITVPDGNPVTQLATIEDWATRVAAGKKVSIFASKELKELSAQVLVDGYPVTTTGHLDLARTQIRLRTMLREAHTLMTQAYAPCQIPVPPLDDAYLFAAEQLSHRVVSVHDWWTKEYPDLTRRLTRLVTTHNPALRAETLDHVATLLDGAAARLEERQLTSEMENLKQKLHDRRTSPGASPLWSTLASALELARPDQWDTVVEETQRLLAVRVKVLRSRELLERIAKAGAPRWARALAETHGAAEVLGEPDQSSLAWARAKARTWLTTLHSETDIDSLMQRSHTQSRELRESIVELASKSARVQLKTNIKDRQRRALETWLTAVKRVGKGTGKNAPRFQAAARDALPAAMGAVPIWIMPIYRVMENFDPRISDLFDVVVVDESSQCDLLSLGVLALGRKSVVVGDDKQTTPERVGVQVDRIAALQDQHLSGMPEARLLTLDESLYSISGRAFPSTIALKEHFRCVPEIIEFSNRYYNGAIQPLREVGVPQIGDPLRVVKVEGAVSIARGSSRVNIDEANAIADQVAACVADSSYDGLTFGIVTMMSGPQARIIQDRIRERIGDEEFEHRRLRVGNPPLFQGDERNVMFVSMVAHDNTFAATTLRYTQWANVAVSRAQDQLWIFHSMDPTTLHHEDQRRAMIEYALSAGHKDESKALYDLTESKFERDVLRQMLERGYEVVPQHRVGSYRIDFVVRVAPGERLAVECDGDSFHGPDKWDDDVRRQRVLERLGWSFWRIRASAYYLDPETSMKPLWDRLEEMKVRAAEADAVLQARQAAAEKQNLDALKAKVTSRESELSANPQDADESVVELGLGRQEHIELRAEAPVRVLRDAPRPVRPQVPDPADVRTWARENGFPIGDRGRIAAEVTKAYREAHRSPAPARSEARPSRPTSAQPHHPGAAEGEHPTQNELEAAWRNGHAYQLDSDGDIVRRNDGLTLASAIGHARAAEYRDQMRALRPHGGRFKVDEFGIMVTLVDGEPTFVCRVTRDNWFPGHLS
ncbi:AAA domain-containing protein [Cellulosimicrobium cellulans]|uniref:AAA domain-containing protein n=1 Tax=Cellulosimicrobium cellulans TaxID=1710 RepID=UPI00214A5E80|nr:AAA domain-containing protein [Cellulosimicrobium cellulans]